MLGHAARQTRSEGWLSRERAIGAGRASQGSDLSGEHVGEGSMEGTCSPEAVGLRKVLLVVTETVVCVLAEL